MLTFTMVNVNPKHRKTGDCSTRALANTLGIPYEKALEEQFKCSAKYCFGLTDKETCTKILAKYGYVKVKQPRKPNGKKYLVMELDELLTAEQMREGVMVLIANHWTVVRNGSIEDIWNCATKTIGNYFVKEH